MKIFAALDPTRPAADFGVRSTVGSNRLGSILAQKRFCPEKGHDGLRPSQLKTQKFRILLQQHTRVWIRLGDDG
jgi:hypothetical protein